MEDRRLLWTALRLLMTAAENSASAHLDLKTDTKDVSGSFSYGVVTGRWEFKGQLSGRRRGNTDGTADDATPLGRNGSDSDDGETFRGKNMVKLSAFDKTDQSNKEKSVGVEDGQRDASLRKVFKVFFRDKIVDASEPKKFVLHDDLDGDRLALVEKRHGNAPT
ncbi:hypothetical protein PIB30_018959 [Stylosanthes scabra]|uniref:Uncharacterized protein n=1 Tax=Stylosanthes scabra TaxID=79078 RepID=A0ABU6Z7N2_9FABA|nr:hypothetical protein [Stylosanthes scabra]